jgi:nucleotide exchange factor SIL1
MITRFLYSSALLSGIAVAATAAAPATSPQASSDLICHTDNQADCYPRLFQPTEEFQTIHDDQDLPPGLHVRMDIYSGKKEARLNIPLPGEETTEEITDRTVVVVPQPEAEAEEESDVEEVILQALRDRVPHKPPVYDTAGKVQPPKEGDGNPGDGLAFIEAMATLKDTPLSKTKATPALKAALTDLSDLAHDIYYGVEIAKAPAAVRALMQILQLHDDASVDAATLAELRHLAAGILSGAVQNNPTALKELAEGYAGEKLAWKQYFCEDGDAAALKAKITALNGLIKHADLKDDFLSAGVPEKLLELYMSEGAPVRTKISQLLMDNFLDADMGAELGVWPQGDEREGAFCEVAAQNTDDGCWEYHLARMGEKDGQLFDLLRTARKAQGETEHGEL